MSMHPRHATTRCLRTLESQYGFRPAKVEGAIPRNLNGQVVRIGAGKFEDQTGQVPHWFDAGGCIASIRFQNGQVSVANKLIQIDDSPEKGRFGRASPSLWNRIRAVSDKSLFINTANTAPIRWGERMFAGYEASDPTEFDPRTLDTIGSTDLGIVRRAFSAHAKWNAKRNTVYNFGFRVLPRPCIDLYALPIGGAPKWLGAVPYSGATLLHDFAVSENYFVFLVSPVFANPLDMLVRGKPLSEAVQWKPKSLQVLVVPIDRPDKAVSWNVDPLYVTHFGEATERDGKIIVDCIAYKDGTNWRWPAEIWPGPPRGPYAPGLLTRVRIDLSSKTSTMETLFDQALEVPTAHRSVVYGSGFRDPAQAFQGLFDCAWRIDTESGASFKLDFGADHAVSEVIPVYAADCSTHLVLLNYDASKDRSYWSIWKDGSQCEEVARVWLDHHVPFTFHGLWHAASE